MDDAGSRAPAVIIHLALDTDQTLGKVFVEIILCL